MLTLAREQMRAADRADAGLFLQQTIHADLAHRGELGPDEFVELHRDEKGRIVAETVKDIERRKHQDLF